MKLYEIKDRSKWLKDNKNTSNRSINDTLILMDPSIINVLKHFSFSIPKSSRGECKRVKVTAGNPLKDKIIAVKVFDSGWYGNYILLKDNGKYSRMTCDEIQDTDLQFIKSNLERGNKLKDIQKEIRVLQKLRR